MMNVSDKNHVFLSVDLIIAEKLPEKGLGISINDRLKRAVKRHRLWYEETEDLYENTTLSVPLCELRNMISVAYLITQQSIKRQNNIGGFYNITLDEKESGV